MQAVSLQNGGEATSPPTIFHLQRRYSSNPIQSILNNCCCGTCYAQVVRFSLGWPKRFLGHRRELRAATAQTRFPIVQLLSRTLYLNEIQLPSHSIPNLTLGKLLPNVWLRYIAANSVQSNDVYCKLRHYRPRCTCSNRASVLYEFNTCIIDTACILVGSYKF